MDAEGIEGQVRIARERVTQLADAGVDTVAISFVDNAGLTRAKAIPVRRFEEAVRSGIGLSPAFHVLLVNDRITSSDGIGGPVGDLRLHPDPEALRILAAQPGWAWAPADQRTQDGETFQACSRSFLRRMQDEATSLGFSLRCAFEVEWFQARLDGDDASIPVHRAPAVGIQALAEYGAFCRELLAALEQEGLEPEQINAEYADGQLECSVAPRPPLDAADAQVLVRQTIRGLAARYGARPSFAPVFAGSMGNGGHLHVSLWEGEHNRFAGGDRRHGLTLVGEAFLAGVLRELPALTAVGCPSVASYLRLVPSHWAGVFACWGTENREAAIRFIEGTASIRSRAANAELKCFDLSSNPYLLIGAVIAAGLAGLREDLELPLEFLQDPESLPPAELEALGIGRLPTSLDEATDELERSHILRAAMGEILFDAFTAVRRAEADAFREAESEAIVEAHLWRY